MWKPLVVQSSSASSWDRRAPVVAVPSPSSLPSSSIRPSRTTSLSVPWKSPSSGSLPSNSSATTPRTRLLRCTSTSLTSSTMPSASRWPVRSISTRSPRTWTSRKRQRWWVCARIRPIIILWDITNAPVSAAMWSLSRWWRQDSWAKPSATSSRRRPWWSNSRNWTTMMVPRPTSARSCVA